MTPTALGQARVVVRGRRSTLEPTAELYPQGVPPTPERCGVVRSLGTAIRSIGVASACVAADPAHSTSTQKFVELSKEDQQAPRGRGLQTVRRLISLRCCASERPPGAYPGRRGRIHAGDVHQSQREADQPFRPRRAASSSTALLNTRQVAATHPANFAGLTVVGFCGHMMTHIAQSSLGRSSTLIRASGTISPEASSIRFGTGISWSIQ
jgi:hypothetical protein